MASALAEGGERQDGICPKRVLPRSLRPEEQHGRANAVLNFDRRRPKDEVGHESVPVRAHGDQVGPVLLHPMHDFLHRIEAASGEAQKPCQSPRLLTASARLEHSLSERIN